MKEKRKRKIIVSIAISADGYIARPDGDVEWLNRPRPKGNYGMGAFFRSIDTILWGRKTYEVGLKFGGSSLGVGPKIKNYVFSRRPLEPLGKNVELVREPIKDFVRQLRREPGKDIWMMGGAGIIASFLDEGEIDEFIIHVIPVFIIATSHSSCAPCADSPTASSASSTGSCVGPVGGWRARNGKPQFCRGSERAARDQRGTRLAVEAASGRSASLCARRAQVLSKRERRALSGRGPEALPAP